MINSPQWHVALCTVINSDIYYNEPLLHNRIQERDTCHYNDLCTLAYSVNSA